MRVCLLHSHGDIRKCNVILCTLHGEAVVITSNVFCD